MRLLGPTRKSYTAKQLKINIKCCISPLTARKFQQFGPPMHVRLLPPTTATTHNHTAHPFNLHSGRATAVAIENSPLIAYSPALNDDLHGMIYRGLPISNLLGDNSRPLIDSLALPDNFALLTLAQQTQPNAFTNNDTLEDTLEKLDKLKADPNAVSVLLSLSEHQPVSGSSTISTCFMHRALEAHIKGEYTIDANKDKLFFTSCSYRAGVAADFAARAI